ncbi:uncharacterized protein [Ptychodera flava]|uniref:uncharacterized protein n=1 Tax=Ptychodera flava TaxID=63121 RepID=UPI00396A3605
MGCGMSSRFKRSRPSVSVTESTQQEFLTETEVEAVGTAVRTVAVSSDSTKGTSRRTKSVGSLFHSRKVCSFDDTVDSSVKTTISPKRRSSFAAQDESDKEQFELPGKINVETQRDFAKLRSVDERQSLSTEDSEPNITTAASSSIFGASSGIEAGESSNGSIGTEGNDRASLDSGFPLNDSGTKSAVVDKTIITSNGSCDNKLHDLRDEDITRLVVKEDETELSNGHANSFSDGHLEHSDDSFRNIKVNGGPASVGAMPDEGQLCAIHKDTGIHAEIKRGNAESNPGDNISMQQQNGGSSEAHVCKCPKQKIGVNTLEQIVEVGKMVSNPAEHSIIYESPEEVKTLRNGDRCTSTSVTLSDVADEESHGIGVTKATVSPIEHPHIDGDVAEDELWPGLVVVHVHQDFFNDFDDCFDDDEILTSVTAS